VLDIKCDELQEASSPTKITFTELTVKKDCIELLTVAL
jgi:hypothetical protein